MTGPGGLDRLRSGFSRFLDAVPGRLHFAAHSHHPWPDVSFGAHAQAWLDAAAYQDDKWGHVFGSVLPEFQRHVAGRLGLSDPATIAVAPNTHELVVRLLSCLPTPCRVLTTDAEFHSFSRQIARLEETGAAVVDRITAEPFASLPDRLTAAATAGGHDLVFFSHVLYDSGFVLPDVPAVVAAVPDPDTFVVVDGYHGYLAVPTDLSTIESRAFYLAGGYKYAMAGEGAAFLHCPPGYGPRPVDTGWYAGFSALATGAAGQVAYADDGSRFLGATFDPSGLYRANAVHRWLDHNDVEVADIHAHVRALQQRFVTAASAHPAREELVATLMPADVEHDRGNFLTVRTAVAGGLDLALARHRVVADHRRDRLRLGFGCYHHDGDVDELWRRLDVALSAAQ